MEHTSQIVGPEEARALLEKLMPNYRTPNPRCVELLAKEMREGRWKPDYEPLRLDEELGLVDGRMRLLAVILAGVKARFTIIRGKFELFQERQGD